jgi:hypothetical protein
MTPFISPESINNGLVEVFHWFFIIGSGLYCVFALLIVRQIGLMKKTLITDISPVVSLLGLIHLLLAVGLLGYYLFLF